jgi:hypothetical protein
VQVSTVADLRNLFKEVFPTVSLEGVEAGTDFGGHEAASLNGHSSLAAD